MGVKKSVYVFLCSLMGVLLFLILDRIAVLSYLILVMYGVFHWSGNYSYIEFVAIDYIVVFFAMFCGSWYGIWLGTYWYQQVYELGAIKGAFGHLRHRLFPAKPGYGDLKTRVEELKQELSEDLSEAQVLVRQMPKEILNPEPLKRRAPRKASASRQRKAKSA